MFSALSALRPCVGVQIFDRVGFRQSCVWRWPVTATPTGAVPLLKASRGCSPDQRDGLRHSASTCVPWGPLFVPVSLIVSCGSPCDLSLVPQSSLNVGLATFTRWVAVADGRPSALGGFARSASGHSSCRCAYPNARGRCCVFGLDLARAPGVVALGSG